MKPYADYTRSERCAEYTALQEQYDAWKAKQLSLNMARGKPSRAQLDMVSGILTVLQSPEDCFDGALDVRNYGELTGIPSAKRLFAELLGVTPSQVLVGGNASLNLMYDLIAKAWTHGLLHSPRPWSQEPVVRFLCPAPGYDRHFRVSQSFGMELIPIAMTPDGPDMDAVEAALSLKDELGCKVVAFTMGPPPAEGMLRELMAMGVDEGVLITAREFGGSDTYATSQIIAAGIDTYGVEEDDIILAGRQAIDGDTAQVGPQIAEKLHLPQVTYAGEIKKDGNTLTVKRMLEDGYMTVKVKTPCMITCIKELNQPRYLSVGGAFEAYSKPLVTMTYETLKDHPLIDKSTIGLAGSPTNILTSFTPPQKGAGMMLEGAGKETTDKLAGILAAKHII